MKILCLIPVYFLVLINAGQQPINEVSDYNQSFDEKPQLVEKGTTAVTGSCTIEKNIFYSAYGRFYTAVKLGNCDKELKAELISSFQYAAFNQCAITPNCSSNANVYECDYAITVCNPFFSFSEIDGHLISDHINWGYNFPVSSLTYMNYNETVYGPQVRHNELGFALSEDSIFPSFFESLIDEGIISNPTLCLAVKSSCSFNSEDEAAGKLLIGKSIPEVFPNSYTKFRSFSWYWGLQVTATSICGEDILSSSQLTYINTSTPYIVMDKVSYTSFLDKLQSDFGIKCLDNGPTDEGGMYVCYVDCAIVSKLPRIGLTLRSSDGTGSPVEYLLKNNLVKFGSEDSNGLCSLAIASHTDPGAFIWRLGTSFFNGRTVCFERILNNAAVYIGSSDL